MPTLQMYELTARNVHPEQRPGEVYLQNTTHESLMQAKPGWASSRLGEQAFNPDGTPTDSVLKPHFVRLDELLAAGLAVDDVAMAHSQR